MNIEKVPNPFEDPLEAGEGGGRVISLERMKSMVGDAPVNTMELSFSRGYANHDPNEYTRVEGEFLEAFDRREGVLGANFQDVRVIGRELFRNAFKHGVKDTFGGTVRFEEYESDTHYAFGFPGGEQGIPADYVRMLGDETEPKAFLKQDGLHGNCYRRMKQLLNDNVIESVAFPQDRRGIYVTVRKSPQ